MKKCKKEKVEQDIWYWWLTEPTQLKKRKWNNVRNAKNIRILVTATAVYNSTVSCEQFLYSTGTMYCYHRIVGPMVGNHWKTSSPMVDWMKTIENHWSQWLSRYHSINGNGHLKNHWFKAMVVIFCLYVWLKLISNKQMLTAQVLVKKMWDWLKM